MTTIAWKVARKADQPIKSGDPLSYTPVTISKAKRYWLFAGQFSGSIKLRYMKVQVSNCVSLTVRW